MPDAVLIAGSTPDNSLQEELSSSGFEAVAAAVESAVEAAKAGGFRAIVLTEASGGTLAQTVQQIVKGLGTGCPPVIALLPLPDAPTRDQCLIAGAHDVSVTGQPDDVATRVDRAVNGWVRGEPRRAIKTTFKAQRGKQALDLPVTEVDPTGFLAATPEGVAEGSLLRVTMGLPDGALIAWGRIASADGAEGVRLLALSVEERLRIIGAVKRKPTGATKTDLAPVARDPMKQTASMRSPVTPMAVPVPPPAAVPVNPFASPAAAAAAAPAPKSDPRTTTSMRAPTSKPPTGPSIADAIGSVLGDASTPAAAEPAPSDEPAVEMRAWPSRPYQPDAALNMLREAILDGVVEQQPDGPAPEIVLAFKKTISPGETHVFDNPPPPELPDPPLAAKGLALRLRLFAVSMRAAVASGETSANILIDDEVLAKLTTDVNALSGDLQKVMDGLLVKGEAARMKQINAFRNTITKAHSDLRATVDRLRGEQQQRGNAAMLMEHSPQSIAPKVLREREVPKEAPKKDDKFNFKQPPVAESVTRKQRQRAIAGAVITVVLAGVAFVLYPRAPHGLDAGELAALPDVKSATINDSAHRAILIANPTWIADATHMTSVETFVKAHNIKNYAVVTDSWVTLVSQQPGKPQSIMPLAKIRRK